MISARLHHKLLAAMMLIIATLTATVYVVTVPWIEEQTYALELEASRTILNNVYEMTDKVTTSLSEQRQLTLDSFKEALRTVVRLAATYVETAVKAGQARGLSDAEARRLAFDGLRSFRYGRNDYVWITDYNAVMLSHPDPERHGRDASLMRDERSGTTIIPTVVEIARREGEGFHEYSWARLGSIQSARKISYFIDLPHLGIVLGSGAYLDEIEAEVAKRRDAAFEQLRAALRDIRIAKTGYAFIFDASSKMLIHPNTNIEGAFMDSRIEPGSGEPIADVLRSIADSPDPAMYFWDKPGDPGNYTYEKISFVRHLKSVNWYIASSVYLDELKSGASRLRDRILAASLVAVILGSLLVYPAAARLTAPLRRLAEAARRVQTGDLHVSTTVQRQDEIGVLAGAFDDMIRKVRGQTENLEDLVRARTQELESANSELKRVNASLQRSKHALADAELRQRHVLDAIPAAIAYIDGEDRLKFLNRTGEDFFDISSADSLGDAFTDVAPGWLVSSLGAHKARVLSGTSVSFVATFEDARGQRTAKTTLVPHLGSCRSVVGYFLLSYDVTDEREADQRLRTVERLAAVGQLSGGLAHDFNNLLSIIIGNLSCAAEKFGDVPELSDYLEAARRASRRGADITSRLLAFSRTQHLSETKVDIGQALHDVGHLIARSLAANIHLSIAAEPGTLWAHTDVAQLENMLVNLAFNSRDAMADGGRLDFVMSERTVSSALAFDQIVAPGAYVQIVVRDTGEGFSSNALNRAFDPFYTTKRNGSGLGLSMVYGFVKQSGGYIRIDSHEGAGAEVVVLFPRVDAPERMPDVARPEEPPCKWQKTALVCEDDADVRRIMIGQLVDLGFSVLEAENGDAAVQLIERLDTLDLVVTDVVMPGRGGIDVAQQAHRRHRDVVVMFCTGDSSTVDGMREHVVLKKPWEPNDLSCALRIAMTRGLYTSKLLGERALC